MGDEGDFGESFRSEDPESQGDTESTEGAEGSDDIEYNTEAAGGEQSQVDAEGGGGQKGGSSTWLIVAIILVVLVIAGVVAYFVFIKGGGGGKTGEVTGGGGLEPTEPGGGPRRASVEPEMVSCDMSVRPLLTNTFAGVADASALMKAQSESSGSYANLEVDLDMFMPASTIVPGAKQHSFIATVFPFIDGNWTFFFTYNDCPRGEGGLYFSDSCYSDTNEFRQHLREVANRSTNLGQLLCTQKKFSPPHKAGADPQFRQVPVVSYTAKVTIDFQAQSMTLSLCEDENWMACKQVWAKEKVPIKSTIDYSSLEILFHNGWSTRAQVGNKYSLDQYVNVTDECKLYKP